MTTAPAYTRADAEALATKLAEFRDGLNPGEGAAFTRLLRSAARRKPDVAGYDHGESIALRPLEHLFEEIVAAVMWR